MDVETQLEYFDKERWDHNNFMTSIMDIMGSEASVARFMEGVFTFRVNYQSVVIDEDILMQQLSIGKNNKVKIDLAGHPKEPFNVVKTLVSKLFPDEELITAPDRTGVMFCALKTALLLRCIYYAWNNLEYLAQRLEGEAMIKNERDMLARIMKHPRILEHLGPASVLTKSQLDQIVDAEIINIKAHVNKQVGSLVSGLTR